MYRRSFLAAGAGLAALAAPSLSRAQGSGGGAKGSPDVLRFVPAADIPALDPIWTTASQTRDHAFLIYDTLYGLDESLKPQPQMVAGHVVENDGRLWRMTLREGLRFHDNTPVLARDCVASIRRWAVRDSFGQSLMAITEELSAPDDKTVVFRLRSPFPQLPAALAKYSSPVCVIMPERLAKTDAFTAVTEPTGSGPFRFLAGERVAGSRMAYERFDGYVPRPDGVAQGSAGPKVAHFKRVEFLVMPDGATAASALQRGEVDFLRWPLIDLVPMLREAPGVAVTVIEPLGLVGKFRFNHLHAPFNDAGVRRAILPAFSQADYMQAANGADTTLWRDGAGFFTPGTAMASDAGMEALTAPRDIKRAKDALAASSYKGEKVVVMMPTDFPIYNAMAEVTGELLRAIGFNVDVQAMDWATAMQRRAKPDPVEAGGWSIFHTGQGGSEELSPVSNIWLRGNGKSAAPGWPESPKLEALRTEWLGAPDEASQKRIARDIQLQAFQDLPYIPTGQLFSPVAHRADLQGVVKGLPAFWNIRRV
ncbi:ABC transporter substrate-binding protein [Roseomonas elaeocarpi]|uniref:ABC transporter substrate-binding protein n=1 Tax=Roseomonas elaeocarpi TaxID=907779 RepID=A0ABV6JM70_9PROT